MPIVFVNNSAAITQQMEAGVRQLIRDYSGLIVAEAQRDAPVDTRALQVSIHAITDVSNDYATAAAAASSLRHAGNRPQSPAIILPEVPPTHDFEATVSSCVAHAAFNEFGTTRMPARPFFGPPWIRLAAPFRRDLAQALTP